MRKTYRAAPSFRSKEYIKGRRDSKISSFFDSQDAKYKKEINDLIEEQKSLKLKARKAWDHYNAIVEAISSVDDEIKSIKNKIILNKKRQDKHDDKMGTKFFTRGSKSLKNNLSDEFNDFNTKYMSPYAIGNTSTYRRKESKKTGKR